MAKKTNLPATRTEAPPPALPYEEFLAQRAAKARAGMTGLPSSGGGSQLSFARGVMKWAGEAVGKSTDVIILGYIPEWAYHDRPFSETNKQPPVCYSYDTEAPHPKSHKPQADACADCPHNEWGSSATGTGKACSQGARIAVIAADTEDFASAKIATARVSTLNAKILGDYVATVENRKKTLESVITTLSCEPDGKSQYRLGFKMARDFRPSPADLAAWQDLVAKADTELTKPYPAPKDEVRREAPIRKSRMNEARRGR